MCALELAFVIRINILIVYYSLFIPYLIIRLDNHRSKNRLFRNKTRGVLPDIISNRGNNSIVVMKMVKEGSCLHNQNKQETLNLKIHSKAI